MTAQKLAKETGVATSTVIRFAEGGEPSLATLNALASQFGASARLQELTEEIRRSVRLAMDRT